ncbi:MAG: ORF6N domain-containing protein [Erysipelotrichaceae bacterium]|nr:ORF6N domain-containing protein [Erysipelotrichaceae bacterium]
MTENNQLILIDERTLKDKIYTIRGQQVMLDSDLAEIYGYSTKAFNQQVKNNIEKFDEDFRFQLTEEENTYLRSKILTANISPMSRSLPYVFTEQGIYMLMTVLKGDLAVQQSKTLIRLFKAMKDHILASQILPEEKGYLALLSKVEENTRSISEVKSEMVSRKELSDMIKLFDSQRKEEEILILDGEPFKADAAYQKIYGKAKKSIVIIDDYISVKTLTHLAGIRDRVSVTVISDNKGQNHLTLQEYNDYLTEYPAMNKRISFLRSMHIVHDRYIFLDPSLKSFSVYHCGASSKDAGKKITTLTKISDTSEYLSLLNRVLGNPALRLH